MPCTRASGQQSMSLSYMFQEHSINNRSSFYQGDAPYNTTNQRNIPSVPPAFESVQIRLPCNNICIMNNISVRSSIFISCPGINLPELEIFDLETVRFQPSVDQGVRHLGGTTSEALTQCEVTQCTQEVVWE